MDTLPDTLDVVSPLASNRRDMNAESTLLPQICSSRTTSAQRSTALSQLEYLIASICVPRDAQVAPQFQDFLKSQAGFESNSE